MSSNLALHSPFRLTVELSASKEKDGIGTIDQQAVVKGLMRLPRSMLIVEKVSRRRRHGFPALTYHCCTHRSLK